MFCSFKFTKKVFVVMCTCFLIGLVAGGFGIHKAVTAVQADKELEQGIQLPIIMYHGILKIQNDRKIRHFSRIAGKRYEISQRKRIYPCIYAGCD
ncbi:MAG: hypothetical protein ACLRRA_07890 [Acutalibacteraceae bacterium]